MSTIAESVSRVRNGLKAVREDAFITDRFIYSLIMKYGKTLMERDNRVKNLFTNSKMFSEIPFFRLTQVTTIDGCYGSLIKGCKIMRSVDKLPKISTTKNGMMIKYVSSVDHSVQFIRTSPERYERMKNLSSFKYNKSKYYWILNDYIYVPDVDYEAISISALFEEGIGEFLCETGKKSSECTVMQENELPIPEYLLSEAEQNARTELLPMLQIPVDTSNDKQNIIR